LAALVLAELPVSGVLTRSGQAVAYQPVDEVGLSLIRWLSDEDGW
jgi:hypothetical protein